MTHLSGIFLKCGFSILLLPFVLLLFKCHAFVFLKFWLTFIHRFSNWFCLTAMKRFEQWTRETLGIISFFSFFFWENEFQRYYHPVQHLKSSVHKFRSSWIRFISVRLPLHVEACGRVIVPEGEQLFQLLKWTVSYICAGVCVCVWWWWGCDEFDLCLLQPPQTASLAELL